MPAPLWARQAVDKRWVLPKDGGGGFGDVVEVEAELALALAEALRCRVRQARQAVEVESALELAEAFRCRVRQARQAAEVELALVLAEAFHCRVRQARQAAEVESALALAEAFRRRVRQARQAFEVEVALVLAEAFRCCVRQARQAVEAGVALVLAEALRCCVRQARQAAEVEHARVLAEAFRCRVLNRRELIQVHSRVFILQKLFRNIFGQYFIVAHGGLLSHMRPLRPAGPVARLRVRETDRTFDLTSSSRDLYTNLILPVCLLPVCRMDRGTGFLARKRNSLPNLVRVIWMTRQNDDLRDRNLLLAEVRDCTISGPRNPVVVCFTSLLSSLTAISSPPLSCFHSPTRNLP